MNYLSKSKMKATGFFSPYQKDGGYSLKTTGCGVYIIKRNSVVIYVGLGRKDVRNTLYRHFQTWTDKRSIWGKRNQPYDRITYKGEDVKDFLIKVIFCKGAIEAEMTEQLLIKKLKPIDNSLKLYLYSQDEFKAVERKIKNAEQWKSGFTENPF